MAVAAPIRLRRAGSDLDAVDLDAQVAAADVAKQDEAVDHLGAALVQALLERRRLGRIAQVDLEQEGSEATIGDAAPAAPSRLSRLSRVSSS